MGAIRERGSIVYGAARAARAEGTATRRGKIIDSVN
jgi:hypothetical protein